MSYTYNTDNSLATKTDAKLQVTKYSYDGSQHITEVQRFPQGLSHAEDVCQEVNYTYGADSTQANVDRVISVAYGSLAGPYNDPNGMVGTCVPGTYATTYTENYAYVPAGGVSSKAWVVNRFVGDDGSGNPQYTGGTQTVYYNYDQIGRTASTAYSMADRTAGYNTPVTLTYSYDSMGRASGLTDNMAAVMGSGSNTNWVQGVTYDYAGRMTQMQYPLYTGVSGSFETLTKGYDLKSGVLTSLSWSKNFNTGAATAVGLQYTYSPTQNNGQITQVNDTISGETISYQYDALKRLTSASSMPNTGSTPAAWTQTFSYDGFGNLTGRVLNGSSYPISIDSAHNQLSGPGYDANGNMTELGTIAYDEADRMWSYSAGVGSLEYYGYDPDNRRVYRKIGGTSNEEWTFFGAKGEKLATYVYATRFDVPTQANVVDFHASASNILFGDN